MKPLPIRMIAILFALIPAGLLPAGDEKPPAAAEKAPAAEGKPQAAEEKRPAAEEKPRAAEEKAAVVRPAVPVQKAAGQAKLPAKERANAMAAAEQEEAMAQQYERYMHPKMWQELEFIRQNCNLTREQRPLLKAAGMASAKEAAKNFVRGQRQESGTDQGSFIRKDLLKTLEKTLTPDQMTQYRQAAIRRAANIKKVVIQSTVARLDSLLYLSAEQRAQITESLMKNWDDAWESWQGVSRYGGVYFPMIPNSRLVPHLNEQQIAVWDRSRKINPNSLSSGRERTPAEEDWWDGKEEPAETPAGATGAAAEPAKEDANANP